MIETKNPDKLLLFLCPRGVGKYLEPLIAVLLMGLSNHCAMEDIKTVPGLGMAGLLTSSQEDGWDGVLDVTGATKVHSLLCFGKTSASIGLPDLEPLSLVPVLFSDYLHTVPTVRLPNPGNKWWSEEGNILAAVSAIKPLVDTRPNVITSDTHLVWGRSSWN